MENVKLVAVGDGAVGKTSLLLTEETGVFPLDYMPTVFSGHFTSHITVGDEFFEAQLWDTAGQDDYDRLRPLAYPGADIFLLCFSIACRPSFDNVTTKWVPEIQHHCPDVPFVLCGTKTDLRDDADTLARLAARGQSVVSEEEGRELAESVGAAAYVECSALTGDGVAALFEAAVRSSQKVIEESSSKRACALL
eukprot:PLAT12531.5.p1 GENE.PLAT12531.5~~PLAT12531.5.p1  ORF type:complete len:194 (+),score=42.13 PLAT12531.5:286-867(+)